MTGKPEAFERFEKLARAIVRVPKKEVAAQMKPTRPQKKQSKRAKA